MSTPQADEQPRGRRRRLRRRALKNLRTALGEAGDQLTTDWVLQDRDLKTLRAEMHKDPTWAALIEPPGDAQEATAQGQKPLTAKVPGPRKGSVTAPTYPWHPIVVISFWLAALLGFGYLFRRALADDAYLAFTVLAAIATIAAASNLVSAVTKRVVRRSIVRRRRRRSQPPQDPPAQMPVKDETAP